MNAFSFWLRFTVGIGLSLVEWSLDAVRRFMADQPVTAADVHDVFPEEDR